MPRYFTVEEANRTLPLVRKIVEDIVSAHEALEGLVESYRSIEGESADAGARRREVNAQLQEQTREVNRFIGELHELGVLFKGFGEGLVDFYSKLEGRPIFLCWKLGEEQVEWWHEIDAGYAGRQRLPAGMQSGER